MSRWELEKKVSRTFSGRICLLQSLAEENARMLEC